MKKLLFKLTLIVVLTEITPGFAAPHLTLQASEVRQDRSYGTNDLFKSYLETSSFRHKILAQNIANLNTPGYKAEEVEIPTKLNELIGKEKKIQRVRLARTSEKHMRGSNNSSNNFESHKLKDPYEIKLNGNNVSLAQQMTKLSQNQQDYNAAVKSYTATNALLSTTLGK